MRLERRNVVCQSCEKPLTLTSNLADRIMTLLRDESASDYCRQLSQKVWAGQCNLVSKGFRQGGVAGLDKARIEEIISGRELPTIDELESIADALKVSMIWLAQRSTISSENWMFEFFKQGGKAVFPAEIFKAYLLVAESYIEKMQGLVKLSPELKADVITTACRVHMKETPNSAEVNPELIRYLLMLPR